MRTIGFIALALLGNLMIWTGFAAWIARGMGQSRRPPPTIVSFDPSAPEKRERPTPKRVARGALSTAAPSPAKTAVLAPMSPKRSVAPVSRRAPAARAPTVDLAPAAPMTMTPAARPVPAAPAPSPAAPAAVVPRAKAPTPAVNPRPGPNRGAIRARLRTAIARHQSYPRMARRQGLEGRVVVALRIKPGGQVSQLRVVRSAGTLLDTAALQAVRRAAPLPYYPDWIQVPIDFRLED